MEHSYYRNLHTGGRHSPSFKIILYRSSFPPFVSSALSTLKMCRYQDKVHVCGHYDRSVEACDKAKKNKSLCDAPTEPKRGRKSKGGTGSTSYSAGIWCPHEGCDEKPNNKREGPGLIPIVYVIDINSVGNRVDGGFDEANFEWDDDE